MDGVFKGLIQESARNANDRDFLKCVYSFCWWNFKWPKTTFKVVIEGTEFEIDDKIKPKDPSQEN